MKQAWTSDVAKTLCAEVGEADPEVAVQRLILGKLAPILDGSIRVNLDEVLDELGIDGVRLEACPGAGYLFDDGRDCWIGVNSSNSEQRRRFTIAHEIVHFMLPTHKMGTYSDSHVGSFSRRASEEEYLCDLGASFLLIPQWEYARMTEGNIATSTLIRRISERFNVSLEAAMVATCTRLKSRFLVAKWQPYKDGFMSLEKCFRSSQISAEFWLPADTIVSPTHTIARVSEARYLYTAKSEFCLKSSNRKIYMSGDYLSLGRPGSRVLSVFRPIQHAKWTPL